MEGTNIYISDTDDQIMLKVLSSISSIIFNEKKYEDILLKSYQEMEEQCNWEYPDGPTDNDDVPNNIPMKQPKTANTKKLGANLAKIFGDDEEEEEENLEVTKIEEKTKNIAEKLNQLSKKEEPKLPPKEIKKPSFFEEEEDKKLPIKKEEIKKPLKFIVLSLKLLYQTQTILIR